jgi:hypothetical protein
MKDFERLEAHRHLRREHCHVKVAQASEEPEPESDVLQEKPPSAETGDLFCDVMWIERVGSKNCDVGGPTFCQARDKLLAHKHTGFLDDAKMAKANIMLSHELGDRIV